MKKLKKKHSSRLLRGADTGSQMERIYSKAVAGGLGKVVAGQVGGPTFVCICI